jgi:hypothetical protein
MARMIEAMPVFYLPVKPFAPGWDSCLSSLGYGKLRQRQGRIQSAERAMPTYLTS